MHDIGKGLEPDMVPGNYSHSQAISIKRLADIAEQVRDTLLVVARDPDAKDHHGFSKNDYQRTLAAFLAARDTEPGKGSAAAVVLAALEQCAKGAI